MLSVDHGHGASADDLQPATVVDHGRGVFIDSQTEERGRRATEGKQAFRPWRFALLEALVDHDALNQAEAGADNWLIRCWRGAASTERDHSRQDAGTGWVPPTRHAALISLENRIPEGRTGDQGTGA